MSSQMDARGRSPPQTGEVCLQLDLGGISRAGGQGWRGAHGPHQAGCGQ